MSKILDNKDLLDANQNLTLSEIREAYKNSLPQFVSKKKTTEVSIYEEPFSFTDYRDFSSFFLFSPLWYILIVLNKTFSNNLMYFTENDNDFKRFFTYSLKHPDKLWGHHDRLEEIIKLIPTDYIKNFALQVLRDLVNSKYFILCLYTRGVSIDLPYIRNQIIEDLNAFFRKIGHEIIITSKDLPFFKIYSADSLEFQERIKEVVLQRADLLDEDAIRLLTKTGFPTELLMAEDFREKATDALWYKLLTTIDSYYASEDNNTPSEYAIKAMEEISSFLPVVEKKEPQIVEMKSLLENLGIDIANPDFRRIYHILHTLLENIYYLEDKSLKPIIRAIFNELQKYFVSNKGLVEDMISELSIFKSEAESKLERMKLDKVAQSERIKQKTHLDCIEKKISSLSGRNPKVVILTAIRDDLSDYLLSANTLKEDIGELIRMLENIVINEG